MADQPQPVVPETTPDPAPVAAPDWSLITILRALGNQDRLAMLRHIANAPEGLNVAQIAAKMRLKRNVTGKHLNMLRSTQIVVLDDEADDGRAAVHVLNPALRPAPDAPLVLEMGQITLRL
jgi:DNA-binding transcriptional ArsR family regulator